MRLLFFSLSIFFVVNTYSQAFKHMSVEDGLSGNFVKTIFKDNTGFIWFGTLDGVDRFDGAEIRNFSWWFGDQIHSVNCISQTTDGFLWLGTDRGLYKVASDLKSVSRINLSNIVDVQVLSVVCEKNRIWVGTNNGLFEFNQSGENSTHYKISENLISITSISVGLDGLLWLSSSSGLVCFNSTTKNSTFYTFDLTGLSQYNKLSGIAYCDNRIFVGTVTHGVYEFNIHDKRFYPVAELGNDYILTLNTDNNNLLYVGTDASGLKIFDPKTMRVSSFVHDPNNVSSIGSNSVYSFLKDDIGRFWIGTYSSGVSYSTSASSIFNVVNDFGTFSLGNKSVRSLYFHPDGKRFIGTRNGLYIDDAKGHTSFFNKNNTPTLHGDIILSIYPYGDNVLIGTYGGGAVKYNLNTGNIDALEGHPEFDKGCVYAFDSDAQGNLWIATLSGIIRVDKLSNESTLFNSANSALKCDFVYALRFDNKGHLWVGTMQGAFCFNLSDGNLIPVSSNLEFPLFKTVGFFCDRYSNTWILTEKGGVFIIDPDFTNIKTFSDKEGLSHNSVSGVVQTGNDEFWLATFKGLNRYNFANGSVHHYGISSGLPGLVFNPNAIFKDKNGVVWFGNEKGLVALRPEPSLDLGAFMKPVITDVFVGGKNYLSPANDQFSTLSNQIHFNGKQRDIGFRFVALNFNEPADNHYAYRLMGESDEWTDLGEKNTLFFQNLGVGSYRLEIVLLDESDKVNPSIATVVHFQIHPLWYQSKLLLALIFIMIVGLFFGIRYKLRSMKQRLTLIQEEIKIQLPEEPKEKYESSRLTEEKGQKLLELLLNYTETHQVFLDPELKIGDLAEKIDCSSHELSQVINQFQNQSFSEFINHYRIEEVKRRLSSPEYAKFTLLAVAESCGFNSKTSFYRIFKKETGFTPAEYMAKLLGKR